MLWWHSACVLFFSCAQKSTHKMTVCKYTLEDKTNHNSLCKYTNIAIDIIAARYIWNDERSINECLNVWMESVSEVVQAECIAEVSRSIFTYLKYLVFGTNLTQNINKVLLAFVWFTNSVLLIRPNGICSKLSLFESLNHTPV